MSPSYDTRIGLYFCGLAPQNTVFQSDLEKHKTKQKNKNQKTRQIPIEGHATKYLTSPPQNSQEHEKQVLKTIIAKRDLGKHDGYVLCSILKRILE